jgi:hypothetical protein
VVAKALNQFFGSREGASAASYFSSRQREGTRSAALLLEDEPVFAMP